MKNSHNTTQDVKQHVCGAAAADASTREPSPPLYLTACSEPLKHALLGQRTAVCCTFRSTDSLPLTGGATL